MCIVSAIFDQMMRSAEPGLTEDVLSRVLPVSSLPEELACCPTSQCSTIQAPHPEQGRDWLELNLQFTFHAMHLEKLSSLKFSNGFFRAFE